MHENMPPVDWALDWYGGSTVNVSRALGFSITKVRINAAAQAMLPVVPLLLAVMSIGGCAIGNRLPYTDTIASIPASGTNRVAVATHDQRWRVTSGKESPTYVGDQR